MNYLKKNLLNIMLVAFMLVLPVISFAQTNPGWYFKGQVTGNTSADVNGPYSTKQLCDSDKNSFVGKNIGTITKDCYEIKSSTTGTKPPTSDIGTQPPPSEPLILVNPIESSTLTELIHKVLEGVIKLGMPIIVLAVIYSGFLFVAARGNSERLDEAKKSLLYTLIGAAILLGSWGIAQLITDTVKAL